MTTSRRLQLLSLAPALLLAACGAGAGDVEGPAETKSEPGGELEQIYDEATWIFQCPTSPIRVPTPGPNSLVLVDAGPHQYFRQRMVNVPVKVKGKVCPAERMNRDGIFVIDVSGSMGYSDRDPPVPVDPAVPDGPKTCGRLQALHAILDRLPPNTTNFAIVTFESSVHRASSRFFSGKQELLDDITTGSERIDEIVCAAIGGTNYATGLRKAKELFAASRQYATKEIYFLSDGEPSDASVAETVANELKITGFPINGQVKTATIATVMLGTADDRVLREKIASHDVTGAPIHAVAANAGDLARILDGLADNHLEGSHLQHGGNTSPSLATIDIMPHLDPVTFEFELPAMELAIDLSQTAYELHFEYWDSHRNRFTIVGQLDWLDGP